MPCLLILKCSWVAFQVEYRYKNVGGLLHPYWGLLYVQDQTVSCNCNSSIVANCFVGWCEGSLPVLWITQRCLTGVCSAVLSPSYPGSHLTAKFSVDMQLSLAPSTRNASLLKYLCCEDKVLLILIMHITGCLTVSLSGRAVIWNLQRSEAIQPCVSPPELWKYHMQNY